MTDKNQILKRQLIKIISETNGVSLQDTIDLLLRSEIAIESLDAYQTVIDFKQKLDLFKINKLKIQELLEHDFTAALFEFFKNFPIKFHEDHIHLTGALTADFILPRLKKLIAENPQAEYMKKISEAYGVQVEKIETVRDVDRLIRLREGEGFLRYLKLLYLPKLIFVNRESHTEAAWHMAEELYNKYNVGKIRLKFSLSRSTASQSEQIPGIDQVTS